ncbi:MAG: hypothetical protein ACI9QN_002761 [Arcticibacterium sp.]|jgi:hypothetical protein
MRIKAIVLIMLISSLSIACKYEGLNHYTQIMEEKFDSIPPVDSLFFNVLEIEPANENYLKASTVKFFTKKIVSFVTEGYLDSAIEGFLEIDSLKKNKKYKKYLKHLDLGDLQDANAFLIQEWDFSKDTTASLWQIKYSSYEACPYYQGTDIYLSMMTNDSLLYTVQVGSKYHAGDPPMGFESNLFSKQKGHQLLIKLSQIEVEMRDSAESEDTILKETNEISIFDLQHGKFID